MPDETVPALRILLLEDSDIDADLLVSHLEVGFRNIDVLRATDRKSFETLLEQRPDMVLADYSLPSFDGLAALDILKRRHPTIPFIFVSGVVGEEFAIGALQRGASDYVTKRNLRRLPLAVSRALEQARERRRAQEVETALRASEIGSEIALRAAKLGGWDFNLRTDLLAWDARCYALMGVPRDETISYDRFLASVHPDDRQRTDEAVKRATTDPAYSSFSEQFRVIRASGEMAWLESQGSAIYDGGSCVRFVGIIRDITSEKTVEIELRAHTASLEASVEQQALERDLLWRNSQDLLVIIGPDGRLRDVTPSWKTILGSPAESVIGRRFSDTTSEVDRLAAQAVLANIRPGEPVAFENRLRHADGSYRWFSWTATSDETGTVFANGRHITEEKEAADRLEQVEEALRQSQKMEAIGQLTGGIAHDFNNLLAGILGAMGIIKRRLSRGQYDDLTRFIDAAEASSGRAAALTQRLLAFSRRQTLDVRPIDIAAAVASMEDLLRRTLGENIDLKTDVAADLWHGKTDANQLESAVLNLAINARDAMDGQGTLSISARNIAVSIQGQVDGLEPGDYVLLSVADTGTGMSEEIIAKAFEPFFTTKPIGQGTGLGLSMVYGFVKQSGGHVRIVSEAGKGSAIELFLPRATEKGEHAQSLAGDAVPAARPGEVVLVIEDDDAVRMLVIELLRDLGYASIEAKDADSALPHIRSNERIDLIVSDVGLPGLNGRELAEITRSVRKDVPILFVTGYAEGAQSRADYLAPGMDMLFKPFQNEDLARRINALLTR